MKEMKYKGEKFMDLGEEVDYELPDGKDKCYPSLHIGNADSMPDMEVGEEYVCKMLVCVKASTTRETDEGIEKSCTLEVRGISPVAKTEKPKGTDFDAAVIVVAESKE